MGEDYVKTDHISTDRLLAELEKRQRESPGSWTGQQAWRVKELSQLLNPPSIER